jgi:hypothetical protein
LTIVKKRPPPKGPNKTQLQQAWVDNFKCIASKSKFADPRARDWAEENAKGTGWYWRDIIETALSGKLLRYREELRVTTPTASIQRTTAEALVNGTLKVLTPNQMHWDNNYFWNPSSNPNRLTIRSPGVYMFGCAATFPVATTVRRGVLVRDNTGAFRAYGVGGEGTSLGGQRECMGLWYFSAGDWIEPCGIASAAGQTVQLLSFWIMALTPETVVSP